MDWIRVGVAWAGRDVDIQDQDIHGLFIKRWLQVFAKQQRCNDRDIFTEGKITIFSISNV